MLAAALAAAAPAAAQSPLPASLSLDTSFAPPTGVARDDLVLGTGSDNAFATAVHGDRIYVVGESANDVGVVARRSDGTLDQSFSEDGKLVIALGTARDAAVDVVVLPDGRLRILAMQTSQTNSSDTDVALIGLNPDGSNDAQFGGGTGRVKFQVIPNTTSQDTPSRLRVDGAGRLAIAGYVRSSSSGPANGFLSLRAPDGSPAAGFGVNGVRVIERGANNLDDRALDVEFRGGGLVAAMQVATNPSTSVNDFITVLHAVDETGADDASFSEDGDLVIEPGEPGTVPEVGLLAHGGRLWLTGRTEIGTDVDGFIARVEMDGSGVQTRRYDARGNRIAADEAVVTVGRRIAVLPGTPETMVVVGSTTYGSPSKTYFSGIAFNDLGSDLEKLALAELLIPTEENTSFGLLGVAAGAGWLAASGTLRNPNNSADTGFGTVKLLVDAEKACDLALEVLSPFELVFAGADAGVQLKVTNTGTKACGGTISVAAPYALRAGGQAGPIGTGILLPGASFTTAGASVSYSGPRRRDDVVTFSVTAAGDDNTRNDTRALAVVFSFCDIALSPVAAALMPTEGSRRFELVLRNGGTTSCRGVRVEPGTSDPFTVPAGRSSTEEVVARAPRRGKPGDKVALTFRAVADGDVDLANNVATIQPTLIGVGDSDIRRAGARVIRGLASGGRGPISKRRLRVSRVDVAIRLAGKGCRWLASARTMKVRRVRPGRSGRCGSPRWLRARGTRAWRLRLARRLPRGTHTVLSRATIAAGLREASFTRRDGNRVKLRVR